MNTGNLRHYRYHDTLFDFTQDAIIDQ